MITTGKVTKVDYDDVILEESNEKLYEDDNLDDLESSTCKISNNSTSSKTVDLKDVQLKI